MQEIRIKEFAGRLRDGIVHNLESRIVFFLGAGCSISSGIPSAGGLVRDWMKRIRAAKAMNDEAWAAYRDSEFPGVEDNPAQYYEKAYSTLFLAAQPGQQEIERLMDAGSPSFGYISLAQLMTHPDHGRQMNVVLTTNFDDLPAEALYLYTRARPRVIAHETLANYSRASEQRPLIVKLHGDAHLDPKSSGDGIRAL
ncbi:MAG: SIR2 family protein, partial [Gammaproteobacteria bacterium]